MSEETIRVLHQSDPNDVRMQFEVIKQLAESVRVTADVLREVQSTQVTMLERLARIEEQKVHEAVAGLEVRVNTIELQHATEKGAAGAKEAVVKWWPVIGVMLLVLWTVGRALGFFHLPEPATAPRAEIRLESSGEPKKE